MAGLAGLFAAGGLLERRLSLGLSGAARAAADVRAAGVRLRHSAGRGAYAALARRGLSRLSAPHQRLLPPAAAPIRGQGRGEPVNLIAAAGRLAERAPLPDALMRAGIELLVGRTRRQLEVGDNAEVEARFAANMA